jgi:hypothetical protein
METPQVGKLIEKGERVYRDAIHVAVAPVEAGEGNLLPGMSVMLEGGLAYETIPTYASCVGIVDPFLAGPVKEGERFYLFLKPGTVTSLRHVWTHPAFVTPLPAGARKEATDEA